MSISELACIYASLALHDDGIPITEEPHEESDDETFLELLEPYILKDMLGSLPSEIMQVLVEQYNTKGWLQRVAQCVLLMDIFSLDFSQEEFM